MDNVVEQGLIKGSVMSVTKLFADLAFNLISVLWPGGPTSGTQKLFAWNERRGVLCSDAVTKTGSVTNCIPISF